MQSMDSAFAYSDRRGLLAYGCERSGICILQTDIERELPIVAQMTSQSPSSLAFSPGGELLVATFENGNIEIWSMSRDVAPVIQYHGSLNETAYPVFMDAQTLILVGRSRVSAMRFDLTHHSLISTSDTVV